MRSISIADQMELDNILDNFPENKRAECVSYLAEVYGLENLEEYYTGYVDEDDIPDCDMCDRPTDSFDAISGCDDDWLACELDGRGYEVFDKDYFEEEVIDKLKELGYIIYKKSR